MVKEVLDEHRLPDDFANKLIHGLETVRWGAGERENSGIGALAAALRAMGEDTSYEYLMGISGAAFRLQMRKPDWCASGPHARCGFDCLGTAIDSLPFEQVDMALPKDDANGIERLRLYGAEGDGYAPWSFGGDGSRERYPSSFVFDWPHLSFGFLSPKGERPERRESTLRSLRLAVELAHTKQYELYTSGFSAYEFWRDGLRDASRFADEAALEVPMQANAHCYYSLYDARSAAATYLREIVDEFNNDVTVHLERAAELYGSLAEDVLARRCVTEIAPMRWSLGEGESWTAELRHEQADLLDEALVLERRAVGELEQALAALEPRIEEG